jgi:hypothetical protein
VIVRSAARDAVPARTVRLGTHEAVPVLSCALFLVCVLWVRRMGLFIRSRELVLGLTRPLRRVPARTDAAGMAPLFLLFCFLCAIKMTLRLSNAV